MGDCVPNIAQYREWWARRRLRYNVGLLVAGALAFVCYVAAAHWNSSMQAPRASVGNRLLPNALLGAIGYLLVMVIANALYFLGPLSESIVRPRNIARYRQVSFKLGFWVSVLLPFVIPGLLIGFMLFCSMPGYGRPMGRSDLPGTYTADYSFGKATLIVKDNGRFTQSVRITATRKAATAAGKWSFDPRDQYVNFEGMMVIEDPVGRLAPGFEQPRNGGVALPVHRCFGRIQITGPPAVPYVKQPSKLSRK